MLNSTAYGLKNGIKAKVMSSSYESVIVRERLLRDHNLTPSTTIKGFIIMVDCAYKGFFKTKSILAYDKIIDMYI